jgi:UDP-N-acetylmuramoylalanine--D-glutamate ligase
MNFKNKKVAVLGAGLEGISSSTWLKNLGALVTIFDQKEEKDFEPEVLEKIKKLDVKTVFGRDSLNSLEGEEIIVRTPSVRPDIPPISKALTKGAVLTSNVKLFFDYCPAKIIGVTGTKGKGTTSTLIYKILKEAGKSAYLGGNIGTAALDLLPDLKPTDFVVLELSSFQLFDLDKSPFVAVVLMVTSEHLDWHKNHEEYKTAKFNIVKYQSQNDFAVINCDYPVSSEFITQTKAKKIEVSTSGRFTSGVFVQNEAIFRRVGAAAERVVGLDEIGLVGRHNVENVAAAIGAATALGVPTLPIEQAIKEFKGLEHRLEFVRQVGGVKYYNDSFSTTPETAIAAIKSFSDPEIIILGGSDKGSDYSQLGKEIVNSPNVKAVILVGKMAEKIKQAINSAGTFKGQLLENAKDMKEIVAQAKSVATNGDVVILSPAAASFDMFRNYKQRGQLFKEEVNKFI